MQTTKYEGLQINNGDSRKVEDSLVVEAALQININQEPYTVVMRTPGDDFELVRGLLFAEDIFKQDFRLELDLLETRSNGFAIINANIPQEFLGQGYMNKRTLLSVSSCGICGKQKLDDIQVTGNKLAQTSPFDPARLELMFSQMMAEQATFEASGGSHAAALFDNNYDILFIKEDIGRHNAVDKVIGQALNDKKLQISKSLLVSGRVSYEIISKAFIAKIPYVIAVSACSTLAVDFAKEFGIGLIGFSRGNKATWYSMA